MAKELFEKFLTDKNITDIICDSAGISVGSGESAAKNAIEVCRDCGIDLKNHKSKNLCDIDINSVDFFVVMNFFQYDVLKALKIPSEKIYVLGGGIEDPFGGDTEIYKKCCDEINLAINDLYKDIIEKYE